jgi:hypothetical protein
MNKRISYMHGERFAPALQRERSRKSIITSSIKVDFVRFWHVLPSLIPFRTAQNGVYSGRRYDFSYLSAMHLHRRL